MRSIVRLGLLCVLLVEFAFSQSQLGTGAINGTVTDPQTRPVEGAQVKVVNNGTGLERDLKTGSEGQFTVPVLPSGEYTVSIEKQGFAPFKQEHVTVAVGESATILASLTVGSVEQTVVVEAGVIDTVKTDTSSDVDFHQIQSLPLNGRRVDQLALLTPGVARSGTFGLLTYNGMAPAFNNYMVEGNDNNQLYFAEGRGRTRIATNISEDAVQEFQVGQSNFLPEFGRATGGSINAVIRSGTNALHGDGFWYYRNQDFGATDPFAVNPITGAPIKPDETRHQFGGSVGGPIKQNKLFFFLNFDAQLRDFPLLTVDTSNALGTFSPGANANDIAAGQALLLSKFPGGAPGNVLPRNFNHYLGLAKVDWTINKANSLSVSYNHLTHSALNGIQTALTLNNVGGNGSDDVRLENLNGRLTTVISSDLVNEFRAQWGRDFEFEFANMPPPNVSVGGFSYGRATFLQRPALPDERHIELVDNLSWIKGKHAFKFGVEYNRIRDMINNPSNFGGAYSYDFVDLLGHDLNNPGAPPSYHSFSQNFGLGAIDFTTSEYGVFAQDQWKIMKNVTLNYGLRWDYEALPSPVAPNPALPNTLAFNSDLSNFGPRVGIAWDLAGNGKSVIRAGYGMFFAVTPAGTMQNALTETGLNDPTKSLLSLTLLPSQPGAPVFPNVLSAPPPGTLLSTFQLDPNFQRPRAQEVNAGFEQEIARNTNVTVTYVFTKGGRLPLNFVTNLPAPNFTRTFQMPDGSTFNVPFVAIPNGTPFQKNTVLESIGESWYHAFMVEVRRRFRGDFEAHAAFTASRALNQTGTGFGDGSAPEGPFGGGSLFDQFNIGSGRDATSQPRRLVLDGVWFLPYGRTGSAWYNALIRDFSLSGLATLETGRPYSTGVSAGTLPFCVGGTGTNCTGGQKFIGLGGVLGQGGLSILPIVPRNNVTGRPNYRLDSRVTRSFKITERYQFQVLAEGFNLFNHSNFTGYNSTAFSTSGATLASSATPVKLTARSNFGTPSQDSILPDGTGARRFQLGVKVNF